MATIIGTSQLSIPDEGALKETHAYDKERVPEKMVPALLGKSADDASGGPIDGRRAPERISDVLRFLGYSEKTPNLNAPPNSGSVPGAALAAMAQVAQNPEDGMRSILDSVLERVASQAGPLPALPPERSEIQLGSVDASGRPNPYGLSPAQWKLIRDGKLK